MILTLAGLSSVTADQNPVGCTGSGLGIALFVDKPQAHIGDTLSYSALVYNVTFPACQASSVQAWVVTPDGTTNFITLRRTTLNPGDSDSYPNVATYVIRAQDVAQGVVRATAADTARIHQNVTLSDGSASQGVNTVIMNPCVNITAACNGGVGQNGQISFTGTIQNCGDVNLAGVTVSNIVDGVGRLVYGPVSLAVGQSLQFSGSYTPANPCNPSSATFVVAGTDTLKQPRTVTATATTTCSITVTPGIGIGANCPAAAVSVGGLFVYSGTITNTGDVVLTNVTVVADQPAPGTVVVTLASLAPKAVASFTGRFNAPTNACSVTTSLSVSGANSCAAPVSASTSITCPLLSRPAIVVTQTCPTGPTAPGGTLTYNGTVKNTGNVDLQDIVVTSPTSGGVVFQLAGLAAGASANFTANLPAPADACSVVSTLLASAKDICLNQTVSNAVTTACNITTAPAITITQTCPATAPAFGGTLTYTATIQNIGNVTLLNVAVVSARPNNTVVFTAASLPPNGITNFTASYPIPANLNGCSITNTLKVTGSDKCTGAQVSASTTGACPVQSNPKIHIVANCPTAPVAPGAKLTYTGTVSNPGDVTLLNVTVVADQPAAGTSVFTVASLAPGTSASFSGSYNVPADACASTVTLVAQAVDACAGATVQDTVTQSCPLTTTPSLTITVNCPATATAPGKLLAFTGQISNTGNITATNVTVVVDRPNANTPVFGPVVLAAGASMPFTGSFVVPTNVNSCTVISTVTVRGNSQCNGVQATASATSSCPVLTTPSILLTTACPPAPTPQGGTLVFTGTVKNTGNIALTNVVITNNRPNTNSPVVTIAVLQPNQTTNFTGSYVVPVNCCEVVTTLSAVAYDLCGVTNVMDTATMVCPVSYTPGIRISRQCPTNVVMPGDQMTFTGAVTNTGNITLTGVTVIASTSGSKALLGPIDLAPGESQSYKSTISIPADFCGWDTVTVTGQSICGDTVTDVLTTLCPVQTTPGIAVVNLPSGGMASCSQSVGHGSVANTGNVTLNGVSVFVNQPAANTPVFGPITLAPGAVTNFDYTYSAPQQCNCCEISVTLTAIGRGFCDQKQVTSTSTVVIPMQTSPKLTVALDCTGATNGLVTGTVQNAGDITLTNVVAASSLPTSGSIIFGPINLAPGETQPFIADLSGVNPAQVSSYSVVVAGSSICGGETVRATASCSNPAPGPLTIRQMPNQSISLSWPAAAGVKYRVEYKNSLSDGAWQTLGQEITALGSAATASTLDTDATAEVRIYRLVILSE